MAALTSVVGAAMLFSDPGSRVLVLVRNPSHSKFDPCTPPGPSDKKSALVRRLQRLVLARPSALMWVDAVLEPNSWSRFSGPAAACRLALAAFETRTDPPGSRVAGG